MLIDVVVEATVVALLLALAAQAHRRSRCRRSSTRSSQARSEPSPRSRSRPRWSVARFILPGLVQLRRSQSGHLGDYVAGLAAGVAMRERSR